MTSLTEVQGPAVVSVSEEDLTEEQIDLIPARDQVTVFGFACTQTPVLMPLPIWLAHRLARRLADVRREAVLPYLVADAKTQVAVEYRDRQPARIHSLTLVASVADDATLTLERLRGDIRECVIRPAFDGQDVGPDASTRLAINPEGLGTQGGPSAHSGLTGRKTAVDTYGEYARHSGAALSGKDPSRIDRVGAYAARHAARNVVAAGLASECEVQLSYSIGQAQPVSIQVETFGTSVVPEEEIGGRVKRAFDFRPAGIVKRFGLRSLSTRDEEGFYPKLAAYGHVGRDDLDLPWEATDHLDALTS